MIQSESVLKGNSRKLWYITVKTVLAGNTNRGDEVLRYSQKTRC